MLEWGAFWPISRMTLLNNNLWLSLPAERVSTPAKAAEGSYPPYNIELSPEDARGPEVLRITLAVAGFGHEDLDVLVEDGELRAPSATRPRRTISTAALPHESLSGPSRWPTASKFARPSCTRAFWPSSSNGQIERSASSRSESRRSVEFAFHLESQRLSTRNRS